MAGKRNQILFFENGVKHFFMLLCAFALSASIQKLGMIQFGGYDGSILINHAWESVLSYKPYADIVTGLPPIFLIGAKLAFQWYGVKWASFVYVAAYFSSVTFLVQTIAMNRLGFNWIISLLSAITTQIITMVVISWWWYNNITSIIAILVILSSALAIKEPGNLIVNLALSFAFALLMLSKPNVAIVLTALISFTLLLANRTRRNFIFIFPISLFLFFTTLNLANIHFFDLIKSYSMYAGRALSLERTIKFLFLNSSHEVIRTSAALLPGFLALTTVLYASRPKTQDPRPKTLRVTANFQIIMIGFSAIVTGLAAMMTNNEYNMTDASLILIGILLIVKCLKRNLSVYYLRIAALSVALCSALLAIIGVRYAIFRYRVMDVGYGAFYENKPVIYLETPALFDGMYASPRFVHVLKQIEDVLNDYKYVQNADAPVFFGPRIDFGYAAFGIQPFRGLPTWWEFFSEDGNKNTDEMSVRFREANFQVCIFLKDDFTYMPKSILTYLDGKYRRLELNDLTVYVRK